MSDARRRKPSPTPTTTTASPPRTTPPTTSTRTRRGPLLPLLTTLLLLPLLSYIITDNTSFTFHLLPPAYHPLPLYRRLFPPAPLLLTTQQLSLYNGSDPTLPLYLALNSTIYDVSANPTTYGKGGGYNIFTGADCTRGFVTGCFAQDRTHDLRGVEEMFLEDDDVLDKFEAGLWGEIDGLGIPVEGEPEEKARERERRKEELRELARVRREKALKRVFETVDHWVKFFEGHEKYTKVGRVLHESLEGKEAPVLCENARKKKPKSKKKD